MNLLEYDLAIIGAGAAGLIAADFALNLGAKTALLEKDRIGGDCTWTGCVPSKSLIHAATVAHHARIAVRYGIDVSVPVTDMARVRDYLRSTIDHIYAPTAPESLRNKGLHVYLGGARFLDPHTIKAGDETIRARKVLVCTGATPQVPDLPGLHDAPFSTYLQIFDNDQLPERLLVLGGGPIGCEIAQAYRRLGASVTVIADRLLPREEPEVSELICEVFRQEGIDLLPARAESVSNSAGQITVHTAKGAATGNLLLVATGRTPVVNGLNLEAAGIAYSGQGIQVDRHLRTTARHIYAAGDVIGGPQYSHLAGWQGFQAVRNALLPGNNMGTTSAMPRITFTSPEIAQIGLTEQAAREKYSASKLQVRTFDIGKIDRAVNEDDRVGFIKIIARSSGHILGATIMGERAGEAMTEIVLAMRHKLRLSDLAATIHPYPTYSTGVQLLATRMSVEAAFSGTYGRILRGLSALWR
ncbi:MAG TPA: FAD-dependent oxidoreductase [Acidobacteriaceae bacterium]|nr:FAD-dependent oxidoreductase [Acidobacteriaceae bacterium]